MNNFNKAILLSAMALGISACNGSNNGKQDLAPEQVFTTNLESGWFLDINNKRYAGGVIDNTFYGSSDDGDYTYGVISKTKTNDVHVMLTRKNGSIAQNIDRVSDHKYVSDDVTLTRNRVGFANQSLMIKNTDWFSRNTSTNLNINSEGEFYNLTMKDTGCTIDGALSFEGNNLYLIEGQALGCIDGSYEGKVKAVGTIYPSGPNQQVELRFFNLLFEYNGDGSLIEKHHAVIFTTK